MSRGGAGLGGTNSWDLNHVYSLRKVSKDDHNDTGFEHRTYIVPPRMTRIDVARLLVATLSRHVADSRKHSDLHREKVVEDPYSKEGLYDGTRCLQDMSERVL